MHEFVVRLIENNKVVIISALDGTFERKPFGSILTLIPYAESVVKLSAVCMGCHAAASFSRRLSDEKELIVVGGDEKYVAVCRKCYAESPFTIKEDKIHAAALSQSTEF